MSDRLGQRLRILLGLGFDDEDGHARVTRGDDFLLLGGGEETHGRMQEDALRFQEALRRLGTDLQSATREQVLEAARRAGL